MPRRKIARNGVIDPALRVSGAVTLCAAFGVSALLWLAIILGVVSVWSDR